MYIRNPYAAWTGCQHVIKEGVFPVWVSMQRIGGKSIL